MIIWSCLCCLWTLVGSLSRLSASVASWVFVLALTVVIGVALKIIMGTSVAGTALRTESGIFAGLSPEADCANEQSFLVSLSWLVEHLIRVISDRKTVAWENFWWYSVIDILPCFRSMDSSLFWFFYYGGRNLISNCCLKVSHFSLSFSRRCSFSYIHLHIASPCKNHNAIATQCSTCKFPCLCTAQKSLRVRTKP